MFCCISCGVDVVRLCAFNVSLADADLLGDDGRLNTLKPLVDQLRFIVVTDRRLAGDNILGLTTAVVLLASAVTDSDAGQLLVDGDDCNYCCCCCVYFAFV